MDSWTRDYCSGPAVIHIVRLGGSPPFAWVVYCWRHIRCNPGICCSPRSGHFSTTAARLQARHVQPPSPQPQPPMRLIPFIVTLPPQVPFYLASSPPADDSRIAHLRRLMPQMHAASSCQPNATHDVHDTPPVALFRTPCFTGLITYRL